MKTIYTLFFLGITNVLLLAQGMTYGTITDAATGEALVAASVLIVGTQQGTVSDADGKYSIQNDGKALQFSYIGYSPVVVEGAKDKLDVVLGSENYSMPGVIAIITDKRIASAHNYSILDQKDLQLQNQADIAPIINTIPGVFMHSGTLSTNRIVIRGIGSRSPFSTNKIKAYLDEIPLTNGSGETSIEDIDLSFLKNIEVWKGPSSSRFGAGLGGTIVMNSDFQQTSYVSMQHTAGAYDLQRNTADIHIANKEKGSHLHLNHNLTDSEGYRDNNQYRRQGLTFLSSTPINTSVKRNDSGTLKVLINFTRLKAFIPSSLNESDYNNAPTKAAFIWDNINGYEDYERLLAGISYHQQIKNKAALTYSFFLNSRNAYELRPFNILTENSTASGLRMLFRWHTSATWSFRLGTELFHENYDWSTYATNDEGALLDPLSINAEKRLYGNVFTEHIFQWNDYIKLNAGLNLNATKYRLDDRFALDSIDQSGDYSFEPMLSPRLTLSASARPNLDYYVLLSHGFSPPSLEETLAPDGRINPDIQPETAWNFELGSRLYNPNRRIQYEWSVYQMWVSNLLVPQRSDFDQFIGLNAGKTLHRGLELQTAYDFFRKEQEKLRLQLSYTFSDFTFSEFIVDGRNYKGNQLPGVPRYQLNGLLSGELFGFYGHLNGLYVHEQALRDDNNVYSDGYILLHAKVGYRFSVAKKWKLDFYAGVNNLLNEHYASMHQINAGSFGGGMPRYYYPGLPRHFYGGVVLRYELGRI
jgi:iron complex outermembrane recepter protein